MWKYVLRIDTKEEIRLIQSFLNVMLSQRSPVVKTARLEFGALNPLVFDLTSEVGVAWVAPLEERASRLGAVLCGLNMNLSGGNEVWDIYIRNCRIPHLYYCRNEELSEIRSDKSAHSAIAENLFRESVTDVFLMPGKELCGDAAWTYIQFKCSNLNTRVRTMLNETQLPSRESIVAPLYALAWPVLAQFRPVGQDRVPVFIRPKGRVIRQCDSLLISHLGEKQFSDALLPLGCMLKDWLKA